MNVFLLKWFSNSALLRITKELVDIQNLPFFLLKFRFSRSRSMKGSKSFPFLRVGMQIGPHWEKQCLLP